MAAAAELAYLSRALKAPRIAALAASLAERARSEGWDYEQYLAQVLSEEVASRETHGGSARIKAARFPQVKTLDDFDFSFARSVKRTQIAHLAQLDFLARGDERRVPRSAGHWQDPPVDRPRGSGGPPRAPRGLRHRPPVGEQAGGGQAGGAPRRRARAAPAGFPCVIVDEVGYIPFDPEAAALFFELVASRYERASLIVSSQQDVQRVGGDLRGPRGRRGHGRPPHPPRRGHRAEG